LLGLFFGLKAGSDVPPKGQFTFNGLHGVIPQKRRMWNGFYFVLS
jgi:hypothetical protein